MMVVLATCFSINPSDRQFVQKIVIKVIIFWLENGKI
jgi:hypothetical protein